MTIAVAERPETKVAKSKKRSDRVHIFIDQPEYETDLRILKAEEFSLYRSTGGQLRMTLHGDRTYLAVGVRRAFPLSKDAPEISFFHSESKEIGILERPLSLSDGDRALVEEELEKRYFQPLVTRIPDFKEEYGTMYWTVDTDRGQRKLLMRNISESVRFLPDGRMILTDIHGNRYEIPDWEKLDSVSQGYLGRIM